MELLRHNRPIASVFSLAGTGEVQSTAALGWTLAHSPALLGRLTEDLVVTGSVTEVRLEQHSEEGGRTDIELVGDDALVVIEAKAGWDPPTWTQLVRYAARRPTLLVVVTAATTEYARQAGLPEQVDGIPVAHRSWREVRELCRTARGPGRTWASQLDTYLGDLVDDLHDRHSNIAVCVSLGPIEDLSGVHGRHWVDQGIYFHPHAKGWFTPPTYLAFRWSEAADGARLRTVRHVEEVELVSDLRSALDDVTPTDPGTPLGPMFVYRLGPHIGPSQPLPYRDPERHERPYNPRALHHRVPIDLLLTCPTYLDAVQAAGQRRD